MGAQRGTPAGNQTTRNRCLKQESGQVAPLGPGVEGISVFPFSEGSINQRLPPPIPTPPHPMILSHWLGGGCVAILLFLSAVDDNQRPALSSLGPEDEDPGSPSSLVPLSQEARWAKGHSQS